MFVLLFVYLGGGVWFSPDSAISEKKIAMLFKIVYLCVCVCGGDTGVFLSIDACIMCFGYKNNLRHSCFDVLKMKLFIFII